jgi:hypothetical protein
MKTIRGKDIYVKLRKSDRLIVEVIDDDLATEIKESSTQLQEAMDRLSEKNHYFRQIEIALFALAWRKDMARVFELVTEGINT